MQLRTFRDYVDLKQGLAINKGTDYLVSNKKENEFKIPLLRIADLISGTFSKFVSEEVNPNVIAGKNDIIYTRTGQIGLAFKGFEGVVHNNSFIVTIKEDKNRALNKDYLFTVLNSDFVRNQALSLAHSSVQPDLTHEMFKDILFPLPNIEEQKRIAKLYDILTRKIDNNKDVCANLESMAKTIYDYWFVQFDFPDANGRPYKTSGGKMEWNETLSREIPAGWNVKRLGEICETRLGGTPNTNNNDYWGGDIPWLNSGEVAVSPILASEKKITNLGRDNSATSAAEPGDVLMSITRYIRPSILGISACYNQSVVAVLQNECYKTSFIYPFLMSQVERYMSLRIGAQQPHINKKIVDSTMVINPSKLILEKYYIKIDKVYRQIINVAKEDKELLELRDFLIPLLMNGQVIFRQ